MVPAPTLYLPPTAHLLSPLGDLIYMEVFGTPIALLNTEAALDLLDKRGALYSDRPASAMAAD
jgi:hypothetical protein